jgi:3-methylcrotonyl-CoA carboxylase alpha subunit
VDSGITSGDVITPFYDAMIAKLIAYGATREDALDTLADMLRQTFIVGPRNNLNFLARLVDLPAVRSAELDTGLIEREQPNLVGQSPCIGESLWLAALAALLLRESTRGNPQSSSTYPTIGTPAMVSPWSAQDGFRLVGTYLRRLVLASQNERCEVSVQYHADAWSVTLNRCVRLRARHSDNHELLLWIDDTLHEAHVFYEDDTVHVRTRGQQAAVRILEVSASAKSKEKPDDGLRSPLPGKVVAVYVKPGQLVSRGAPLVSLEAMKMEHTLTAPAEGTIETVHVREGQQIGAGVPLLELRMS